MTSLTSSSTDKRRSLHRNENRDTSCTASYEQEKLFSISLFLLAHSFPSRGEQKHPRGNADPFINIPSQTVSCLMALSISLFCSTLCYIGSRSPHKETQDGVGKKALLHFKLVTTEIGQCWTEVAEFQNKHVHNFYSLGASCSFPWPMSLVF